MRQFTRLHFLRDPRSFCSQRGRHIRLRSEALLAHLIFYTATITLLDCLGLPLVPQPTRLLRPCHLHAAGIGVTLSSTGCLRTLLASHIHLVGVPQIVVGELWIILLLLLLRALRLHENLLVPLHTIALVWANSARLEGLPRMLSIARVIATTELEHGMVLMLTAAFLLELGEVHRRKVRAPVLVKLLLT